LGFADYWIGSSYGGEKIERVEAGGWDAPKRGDLDDEIPF